MPSNTRTDDCPLCEEFRWLTHKFFKTSVCQDCYAATLELQHLSQEGNEEASALWDRAAEKVEVPVPESKSGVPSAIRYARDNW